MMVYIHVYQCTEGEVPGISHPSIKYKALLLNEVLTINEHHRLADGLLVSDMALQELLGDVGTEVGRLVPTNLVVVHVDSTKLLQNVHLVLTYCALCAVYSR